MKKILLAAAGLMMATAAHAETTEKTISEAAAFAGPYVGAFVGFTGANSDGVFDSLDVPSSSWNTDGDSDELFFDKLTSTGAVFGGFAGFNYAATNKIIVGVEIDGGYSSASDSLSVLDELDDGNKKGKEGVQSAETDFGFVGSARLRAGYVMGDIMPYATAGLGVVHYDVTITDAGGNGGNRGKYTVEEKFSEVDLAPVIGGGIEWAVNDSLRVRAEGLVFLTNDKIDLDKTLKGEGDPGDSFELKNIYQLRLGLSWRF